jgi:hypothetical protein
LYGHLLVVAFDADHLGSGTEKGEEFCGVRASVNHIAQTYYSVLGFQFQPMQESPKGSEVTVKVTNHKDPMPIIKS